MLASESRDFSYFSHEFKDNYRKGVHRLRAILAVPLTARQFAANRGGVAVVLGTPEGKEDRNSAELRTLLLSSGVVDQAVESWLHGFYEFPDGGWDRLLSDMETCRELANSAFMFRSVSASPIGLGKLAATLAGQDCASYENMTAVAASPVAVAAIWESAEALAVVKKAAWEMFTGVGSAVIGKAAAILAGQNPADYADIVAVAASPTAMTAVAASQTAMTAVAASPVALNAVLKSGTARTAFAGSSYLQSQYSKITTTTNNTTYFNKTAAMALDSGFRRAIGNGNTDQNATPNQSLALIQKMGTWGSGNASTTTVIYHLQTGAQVHSVVTTSGPVSNGSGGANVNKVCIGGCKMTETGDGGAWGIYVFAL